MYIKELQTCHMKSLLLMAQTAYDEEAAKNQYLFNIKLDMDFNDFLNSGLSFIAIDNDEVVGYMCAYGPISYMFGCSKGVYVPLFGHGAQIENRSKIYTKLYQHASKIWVDKGLLSHSITAYYNDSACIDTLFENGFGSRCADGIRPMEALNIGKNKNVKLQELNSCEYSLIHPLHESIGQHLSIAPTFMPYHPQSLEEFLKSNDGGSRYFTACADDKTISYLKISNTGETFISKADCMQNICGAYTLPAYRGSGIFTLLMDYAIRKLIKEGYTHLGVDYETINPSANAYWSKYFTPYTRSVTRRIDERALK